MYNNGCANEFSDIFNVLKVMDECKYAVLLPEPTASRHFYGISERSMQSEQRRRSKRYHLSLMMQCSNSLGLTRSTTKLNMAEFKLLRQKRL